MKPNEIRAALMLADIRINKIAHNLNIKPPAVHQVINGQRKNPRIRAAIAKIICKPVSDIWPEQAKVGSQKRSRSLDAVRAQ